MLFLFSIFLDPKSSGGVKSKGQPDYSAEDYYYAWVNTEKEVSTIKFCLRLVQSHNQTPAKVGKWSVSFWTVNSCQFIDPW